MSYHVNLWRSNYNDDVHANMSVSMCLCSFLGGSDLRCAIFIPPMLERIYAKPYSFL